MQFRLQTLLIGTAIAAVLCLPASVVIRSASNAKSTPPENGPADMRHVRMSLHIRQELSDDAKYREDQ